MHSNRVFVTELARNSDILCIQEHWLNQYDLGDLHTVFPECTIHSRAHECTEMDHSRRTGGRGGVATIVGKRLAAFVDTNNADGSCRILVTTINAGEVPLCIMNCYLPSGTGAEAVEKLKEDMDAIHVLIQKYGPTHEILVIGDLNLDHYHRHGPKERALRAIIKENCLEDLGVESQHCYSYINPYLKHQSRIDHALVKRRTLEYQWTQAVVTTEEVDINAANTSYHQPLTTHLKISSPLTKTSKKAGPRKKKVYPRKDTDYLKFTESLDEELCQYGWDNLDPEAAIPAFQKMIDSAIICSTPARTINTRGRKKQEWYPELAEAVKISKIKHLAWKKAGRPRDDHPSWKEKKEAKKGVRRVQRRKLAEDRRTLIDEIGRATENDPQLACKLIKKQARQDSANTALQINGRTVTENAEILDNWATYFENLSRREEEGPNTAKETELDLMRIQSYIKRDRTEFTASNLKTALSRLKSNKAADLRGHHAELLKKLSPMARDILLSIINKILKSGCIPAVLKEAYKIVLPKPGKNHGLMDNYRGITMASVILKVMEMMWLQNNNEECIDQDISDLQFGFTANRSPSMASLLLTEAILEAKSTKKPLHIISLDARKAFDVVDHTILKQKLFQAGIQPRMWRFVDDLYYKTSEVVRWKGEDSRKYNIKRGVKQGSIVSPLLYKLYINQLLLDLERSDLGMKIGETYIGCPTCADDVTLLTDTPNQIQPLLNIATEYASQHLYQLHPHKSSITSMTSSVLGTHENQKWHIGNEEASISSQFVHLGLTWKSGTTAPDVNDNIKKARRAAYSLLRIGLHGIDGLDPASSHKIIQTYVVPRLLHGLDATILGQQEIKLLEQFYKRLLRQIQTLPENTATEAIYLLLGAIPIENQLHRRVLNLFGNICRLPANHSLKKVALRQLAVRFKKKQSWFSYIVKIGEIYNIDIHAAITIPATKEEWKKRVKIAILHHATTELVYKAGQKTTLKWWIWSDSLQLEAHQLWKVCQGRSRDVLAASTRAKMLTGRYKTKEVELSYTRNELRPEDLRCPLCAEHNEDIFHMITTCPSLEEIRAPKIEQLLKIYKEDDIPPPDTPAELCSAVLNGWGYARKTSRACSNSQNSFAHSSATATDSVAYYNVSLDSKLAIQKANSICNRMCYMLAVKRDILLFAHS